ncbi:MAG: GyrI-like domain-containing protein [Calditrichia bacterium]
MKRFLIFAILIFTAMSVWMCGRDEVEEEPEAQATTADKYEGVAVKSVEKFNYVALPHTGPFEDHEIVINQFFQEMNKQGIRPSGQLMGIYYSDPEQVAPESLKWKIAIPVGDSIGVKKPLEIGTWKSGEVLSYMYTGNPEGTEDVYRLFGEYMHENNLNPAGPAVERFLDEDLSQTSMDTMHIEIWFPVSGDSIGQ